MKITLVYSRMLVNTSHPIGLLSIAAYLEREGHEVKVIDPSLNDSDKIIVQSILRDNPDIVGFTAVTLEFNKAMRIATELKKHSDVPVVIGGVHATILPEEVANYGCFDYIVVGEGEETVSELLNAIKAGKDIKDIKGLVYKKGGKVIFNSKRSLIEDIDSLPFPARHLMPDELYYAPPKVRSFWSKRIANIMVSRGCPFQCNFCSSNLMFGRRVRLKSPKRVIEEIRDLRVRFNIDALRFDDDTFCVNREWTLEVCKGLENLRKEFNWKNLKWCCQSRVDTITPELLAVMKKAGCKEIDFGVESGSPRILGILKKNINIPSVIKAFDITKKFGILRGATFIIGTPGETEEDLKLTEKLVRRIKPNYADFCFMIPFPGTGLYEITKKLGIFSKEDVPFDQWLFNKDTDKPIMSVNMPEERLIYWRTRLYNLSFWRNYSNLVRCPGFILGSIKILIIGHKGFVPGLKRFIITGKIDSFFLEHLNQYRIKLKRSALQQ